MPKRKARSRTLWLNGSLATLAGGVLLAVLTDPDITAGLNPVLVKILLAVLAGLGVGNVGLRMATGEPLEGTKAAQRHDQKRLRLPEPVPRPRRSRKGGG
jgi:hypothetical protein